jgi:DNA-binding NarL/FixJ family response regulator
VDMHGRATGAHVLRRPLPWLGHVGAGTVRVLVVSLDTLWAEAVSSCIHAHDGIEVVGLALETDTLDRAVEALRPGVLVVDQRSSDQPPAALFHRARTVHEPIRGVLVAGATATRAEDVMGFHAVIPPRSSLDRLTAAIREVGWHLDARPVSPVADDPGLTAREREVLKLLASGTGTGQIASGLHLSPHTVRNHVRNIFAKLDVHSRVEAVAEATRRGML